MKNGIFSICLKTTVVVMTVIGIEMMAFTSLVIFDKISQFFK